MTRRRDPGGAGERRRGPGGVRRARRSGPDAVVTPGAEPRVPPRSRTWRSRAPWALAVVVAGLLLWRCPGSSRPVAEPAPPSAAKAGIDTAELSSRGEQDGGQAAWRHPAVPRLVAVGDLHGDLAAARASLRLAGAIDAEDRWIGGPLVVVQTGDQLDRGDEERPLIELLERLVLAARAAGGALHRLTGNHELMNVQGDFRYVTPAGLAAFSDHAPLSPGPPVAAFPAAAHGRAAAFLPGGPFARRLAEQPVVLAVGDTLFVHGGLRERHLRYGIERLNRDAKAFMTGEAAAPAAVLVEEESPVWTRHFSASAPTPAACAELERVTNALGVARMIVGHTVQKAGISSACEGRVWRIDVGLAAYYGGGRAVLEITPEGVRPLLAAP